MEEEERRERDLLKIFIIIIMIILMMTILIRIMMMITILMKMMMMTQDRVAVVGDVESGADKVFCHLYSSSVCWHQYGDDDYKEKWDDL